MPKWTDPLKKAAETVRDPESRKQLASDAVRVGKAAASAVKDEFSNKDGKLKKTRLLRAAFSPITTARNASQVASKAAFDEAKDIVKERFVTHSKSRDIPPLYPDFFESVLTTTGKPVTPRNIACLAERVVLVMADSAHGFFEQAGDADAREEFDRTFGDGAPDGLLYASDEMIDWLWDWNEECREPLREVIEDVREFLTAPDSFLHTVGDEIPPLYDDER